LARLGLDAARNEFQGTRPVPDLTRDTEKVTEPDGVRKGQAHASRRVRNDEIHSVSSHLAAPGRVVYGKALTP
jgi:hypothetical protein